MQRPPNSPLINPTHFISQEAFDDSQFTAGTASLRLFILSLAAGLSHEVDVGDDHVLADRLAHVVDGEQGDGGSHEGLHFDPRLPRALHPEKWRVRDRQ